MKQVMASIWFEVPVEAIGVDYHESLDCDAHGDYEGTPAIAKLPDGTEQEVRLIPGETYDGEAWIEIKEAE